jgi:multisubunit Na+/H+ antiporter MnhB subunit
MSDANEANQAPQPTLPPPPLARETPPRPPDVRLPWFTPLAMALAGAVGGVVWKYWLGAAPVTPPLRYFVVTAGAMGLGAMALDHLAPRWPRSLRWSLGMAAAALVPLAGELHSLGWVLHRGRLASCRTYCAIVNAEPAAVFALTGLAFACGARAERQRWWALPAVAALVAGAAGTALDLLNGVLWHWNYTIVGNFAGALAAFMPGGGVPLRDVAIGDAAFGLFLGSAIAVCLWFAHRKAQAPTNQ